MPDIRLNFTIYDYAAYDKTGVPLSGEIRYFSNVISGQLNNVSVLGDNSSKVEELPFREVLEISSSGNVDLEDLRLTGNRCKVFNSSSSSTIEIEIGTTATSVIFYLLPLKEVNLFFNGSVWAHKEENTITMADSDLTLPDLSGPTRIIQPASGITANRTVTLPTLADNLYKQIRFDNLNTSYQLIIDGEGAETIEGFSAINLSTEYSIIEGQSSEWKRIGYSPIRPKYQIEDRKAASTNGGTFTSGAYRTRDLNTEIITDIIGASLSSNQFTLPIGKYRIQSNAPCYHIDINLSRLRNITDGTTVLESISENVNTTGSTKSQIIGEFIITAEKTFEIQHYCNITVASTGLGFATNFGDYEHYTKVILEKLI